MKNAELKGLKHLDMIKYIAKHLAFFLTPVLGIAQVQNIPLDTLNWEIEAKSYVLETYKGQEAIYLQGGSMRLKEVAMRNGTIEYDIFLKKEQAFPGLYFRINEEDAEHFYLRPHQSGNPDANQAIPLTKGLSPWQLYYGKRYSFPYTYRYDDWTHVKVVFKENKAQVFLDYSDSPNLSWELFHSPKEGGISLNGGNATGMHIANIKIDKTSPNLIDFKPIARKPIEGLIPEWEVSDKFEEKALDDIMVSTRVISDRKWNKKIRVEEGTAANISREVQRYDNTKENTVFARVTITAEDSTTKLFEFGYSDRVVVILNGKPIYKGSNNFRSRDYRYLGTVGLFDAVFLNLNKGKNTLLLAVSEDFGGWLVTGKLSSMEGIKIQ